MAQAASIKFAVGKYNKFYSNGWRKVTADEWRDPAIQAQLVAAHQKSGGWPLLEEPLVCNAPLFVAEGVVMIDEKAVSEVGCDGLQELRDIYPAMNYATLVAWTKAAPIPGNNWTIQPNDGTSLDPPCLYIWAPSGSRAAFTGVPRSNAPALEMKEDPPQFAVGYHNMKYDGYRKVTTADWMNRAFQAALVEAHRKDGGWPLLEKPLECIGVLEVAEGRALIDTAFVVEVGFNTIYGVAQQLHNVYPAMNNNTNVAWTTRAPALGKNWTVRPHSAPSRIRKPCLFVHESYNPAPGGGSRRSRRHKRRNYVKKQKKRTRKH